MSISKPAYIGLAVSVAVGLIIMVSAYLWMRSKTKKIKEEYSKEFVAKDIKPRENYGKLL